MRLNSDQLSEQLRRKLLPCYLVSGEEPLQLGEACDAIRKAAKAAGYTTRTLLEVDTYFKWEALRIEADSLSLFSDKKIIDLRIPSGKPGTEGSKALLAYASRPPADTLLLITLPKLERQQTSAKWLTTLVTLGALVTVWPIEGARLHQWLRERMERSGLRPTSEVITLLSERIEGNLLAAAQEIEKLLLLHGTGPLDAEQLLAAATDSARFDLFKLADAALQGNTRRCLRILTGLQAEGTAEPLILWALARETRTLLALRTAIEQGIPLQQALARPDIWEKRRPLLAQGVKRLSRQRLQQLLQRCALADRAIKGRSSEAPWLLFQEIVVGLSGVQYFGD